MGLDELRARLENLLASRSQASGLHAALVEFKVALGQSRDALVAAERELASEREQLASAERRARLATEIGDTETVGVAEEFAGRHRERSELLDRKVGVIRDELAWLEREYAALGTRYQAARHGIGLPPDATPPEPAVDGEFDAMKARADREAAERAVAAQLEHLKKKMGKQ